MVVRRGVGRPVDSSGDRIHRTAGAGSGCHGDHLAVVPMDRALYRWTQRNTRRLRREAGVLDIIPAVISPTAPPENVPLGGLCQMIGSRLAAPIAAMYAAAAVLKSLITPLPRAPDPVYSAAGIGVKKVQPRI